LLNKDYKTRQEQGPAVKKLTRKHWHMLAVASAVVGVIALLNPSKEAEATRQIPTSPLESATQATEVGATPSTPAVPPIAWQDVQVEKNDTLSQIFDRLELDTKQMYAVLDTDKSTKEALTHLVPGETIHFKIKDGVLDSLRYHTSPSEILHVDRAAEGYQASTEKLPVETRMMHASGVIESSLYVAGQQAGISDNLLMQMVGLSHV